MNTAGLDSRERRRKFLIESGTRKGGGRAFLCYGHGVTLAPLRLRSLLARSGVRNWQIGHNLDLPGSPDIVFPSDGLAVFVDGCFWHGCARCRSIPVTNRSFWSEKIGANKRRDRLVARRLRARGWVTLRIWEHELRGDNVRVLERIATARRRRGK